MVEIQGQKTRIEVSLGTTRQVGEFDFTKCYVSMARDVEPGEDPSAVLREVQQILSEFLSKQSLAPLPTASVWSAKTAQVSPQLALDPEILRRIVSLEWMPGHIPGRQWVRIADHEESLEPFLHELRRLDPKAYLTVGDYRYRLEGDFIGRYPVRKQRT
jgi:hypothetical protein